MKQSKLIAMLPGAVLVFFLISCGGSSTTEKTATDSATVATADTTAPAVAAPANTIVTTPQNMVVITHKVANFAKWMAAFDEHDSARLASGLHKYVIGRGFMDTNIVLVALKADDITKAKAFAKDPSLKKVMQKGGVTGTPTVSFVTATWRDTSDISFDIIRSRTIFSVKDFDAWVKSFQDGKQERMDNGIADRTISHDADDNKKVSLVTAVLDTAKAFAYYKSDALKKRREAGGVIGTPSRFLYRIIKRY
jgi:hypothetical protein